MNRLPQIMGFMFILDVVLLDQISKWAIIELFLRPEIGGETIGMVDWFMSAPDRLEFISVPIMPYFNLSMVWNQGVSFGMFQDLGIWPLTIMALVIVLFLMRWIQTSNSRFEAMSLGMIVGGAIGNVIDRLRFGAVADFFDVYVGTYHWPAFNIADSAITIGVVLLLIHGLFLNREEKQNA